MSPALLTSLAVLLTLTIAFEAGFFLIIGKRDKKDLLLLLLVNVLTNPLVVLLFWLTVLYTNYNTSIIQIPLELFAVFTEGYYYKRFGRGFRRPYLFSAGANIFSYGSGLLIQQFI